MRRHLPAMIAISLAWASAAQANSLIAANRPARVAGSALSVTPTQEWNKLSWRPGRSTEVWTIDGDALNNLTYYGGIQNDRPILREIDRRNQPLPRFAANMLLLDIPTLLENSYRAGRAVRVFTISQVEPASFGGQSGVRFAYEFVGADEVRRRGEAQAAVVDGRLYLVTFEAPALHYFDVSIGAARQVMSSAAIRRTR